jgi:glycosyltransferase involved in cell wall biosynthesis
MHIVQIMSNTPSVPYFNWFAEEVKNFPDYKFSFIVMYPSKPQMLEDMRERECDCYWIPFDYNNRKKDMISAMFKLIRLFKIIKPDVVNTHLFDDSLPGLLAARLAGIKKRVITKNDTTFHWNYAKKWVWADRLNNYNATDIVAISHESKEFILTKEKALSSKVTLIHHGISIPVLSKQNETYKKELTNKYGFDNCIVIGTISRYIEWKGYRYIIEAAAEIVKKHPNAKFIFAGDGPQYDEMNILIAKYKLQNNIIITGWVSREYIPSLYGIMDIYVHAASKEPFGFVIAEAMANGVPLVTTKTGAAADALEHKKNCYFVAEKCANDIVMGVNWMLEDVQRRKEIARESNQQVYAMYDVKDMLKKYLNVYSNNR